MKTSLYFTVPNQQFSRVSFKRLGLRYDRTEVMLLPLLLLAVTLINHRRLRQATEL